MSNAKHSIYCSLNLGAATQAPRVAWLESTCPADKGTTELWSSPFFKKAESTQQKEQ